jgi:para-nitrobenzyl esterase
VTIPLAQAERAGIGLGERMGAPGTGALRHMRSVSTADVLKASPAYMERGPLRPEPCVDGHVLPRVPAVVFRAGEEIPVPLIIGNNAREQSAPGGAAELEKGIAEYYGALAPKASQLYGRAQDAPYPPYGDSLAQFRTDTAFRCPADTVARWRKLPTWQYEFSRGIEPQGASHSFELRYIFGIFPGPVEDVDHRLADQIQQYWANFARTGDPDGAGLAKWPRLTPDRREYLEFGTEGVTVKSGLRVPYCELFREKLGLN